jgi:hypothetical protein
MVHQAADIVVNETTGTPNQMNLDTQEEMVHCSQALRRIT